MQALGPTPEASLPVFRATGPGGPVFTTPFGARGALPACTAGEPPSCGGEQLDVHTIPEGATAREF